MRHTKDVGGAKYCKEPVSFIFLEDGKHEF